MGVDPLEAYQGREATAIKHLLLRCYLQKLAYKISGHWKWLNYVEGFAGPWNSHAEDLSDTSPHIAITELRKARGGLARIGRGMGIRCLFVEADKQAAALLERSLQEHADVSAHVLGGRFLDRLGDIADFVRAGSQASPAFTFLFVDPTGWTGYDPEVIAPLLRSRSTEILINFMTKDIIRFINHGDERIRRSFNPLFGSQEARIAWEGPEARDREEAIVARFCERLKEVAGFGYVVAAIVLNPTSDRTHFHLIYGTHDVEGLRTFREVEAKVLEDQVALREKARHRRRIERTGQPELFGPGEVEFRSHVEELRDRYHHDARSKVETLLRGRGEVPYDELEVLALLHPMTSAADLKRWLGEWRKQGLVQYRGLADGERTPKAGKGHRVSWG